MSHSEEARPPANHDWLSTIVCNRSEYNVHFCEASNLPYWKKLPFFVSTNRGKHQRNVARQTLKESSQPSGKRPMFEEDSSSENLRAIFVVSVTQRCVRREMTEEVGATPLRKPSTSWRGTCAPKAKLDLAGLQCPRRGTSVPSLWLPEVLKLRWKKGPSVEKCSRLKVCEQLVMTR